MPETYRYAVTARNTATESTNKIHDDTVAQSLGFRGGLVPGVDVYAYLCHVPAEAWGLEWLRRGTITTTFASPVYDGDTVAIEGVRAAENVIEMTLTDSQGNLCASGAATLPVSPPPPPRLDDWPREAPGRDRVAAAPESLRALPMAALEAGFHADHAQAYLDDIGEGAPLFRHHGVAHPGWLLRFCNWVLTSNFELGPWIHVESTTQFFSSVADGERVQTRAKVSGVDERSGHRFVDLDVLQIAGDDRPVARVAHRAIYQPRGTY